MAKVLSTREKCKKYFWMEGASVVRPIHQSGILDIDRITWEVQPLGMTTKQYLSQIRQLDMIIRHKEEELEKMRNPVGIRGIDYSADRVQRSPSNNGMAAVEQMVDRQRKAQSELNSLIRKRDRIISQIQSMDNAVFSQVLYMRYVEGERLEDIARELGYVYSYARKLHGWALQDFERRNKKEQKGTKENMTNKKNVL